MVNREKRDAAATAFPRADWQAIAILAVVSVLIRTPFLGNFELVAFDGTYYINQARVLWSGGTMPGQFPIGYPLLISLLLPIVSDGVIAAQIVSFLSGLGTLVVMFFLGQRYLPRHLAFYAALLLAVMPLFIRLSLSTLSESAYVLWMLLTLLLFARRNDFATGLCAGMATITRNEMLAVVVLLALLRAGLPPKKQGVRGAVLLFAGFAIFYALNMAVFYRSSGEFALVQKTEFFGTRAQVWEARELSVEEAASGPSDAAGATPTLAAIARTYVSKLPLDVWSLTRQLAVVAMLLALFGAVRRPSFLLVALIPMLAIPLFTVRVMDRYLLPYAPVVLLYAVIGADRLRAARPRRLALLALAMAAIAGAWLNISQVTRPDPDGTPALKNVGLDLRDQIRPGDKIADRKPYTAFYAGAEYTEIPQGNYDATMEYLWNERVRFLLLHQEVISRLRPVLAHLLDDAAVIQGELRYRQAYLNPGGVIVYERTGGYEAPSWRRLHSVDNGRITFPTWLPDASQILFVKESDDDVSIHAITTDGGSSALPVINTAGHDNHPAVSRDGTRLAFASTVTGNYELFTMNTATGETRRITEHPGLDGLPSWLPGRNAVVFVSNRGGDLNLWRCDLATGGVTQLTHDGGNFPSVSPSGTQVAFVRFGVGVGLLDVDSGDISMIPGPTQVQYPPSWSPDERFIAVTAKDWGSVDVYLLMPSTGRHILLTKNHAGDKRTWFDGYPAFAPDGKRLAVVSNHEGTFGLYVLDGLEPFFKRLEEPIKAAIIQSPEN